MKKLINRMILTAALLAAAPLALHAAPSFSGAIGGSAGVGFDIPLSNGESDFRVPLAGFAAVQANITDWCVARGELAIDTRNFEFDDIFGSAESSIKLNELSIVLIRRAVTLASFFSGFLGSYEQIGGDAFLMRQFAIEPICSRLSKSATNLAGVPILRTKGAGLSYIVKFDKAPIATGAYFYVGKNTDKDWTLNADARFAYVSNLVTLDVLFGASTPLQDKYNDEDVVLMIDTICLHGGASFLAGSKYTHSLFMQFGIKDFAVKGGNNEELAGDAINFLFEPRINFKKFRMNITAFAYDEETYKETIYLPNEFGAAVTFYKDDIETKRGYLTLGIHTIFGIGGKKFLDYFREFNKEDDSNNGSNSGSNSATESETKDATYNVYITPFAEIPLSRSASLEAMAQIGVCDISGDMSLNFKITASARKTF